MNTIELVKKYELTENTKNYAGETLYRIRALKDFGTVKKGYIGGWVQKKDNLAQSGDCWVSGDANISGNARISGNASIYGDASISDNARISGNANISGNAYISGSANISGNASISGNACISGNARVYGNAYIFDNALIYGDANIYGDARISDNARIYGNANISGNAYIFGNASISGNANIYYQIPKASRSDNYDFIICKDKNEDLRVIAGCRYFSVKEAYEHWNKKHERHEETVLILDYLVSQAKRLGWEVKAGHDDRA